MVSLGLNELILAPTAKGMEYSGKMKPISCLWCPGSLCSQIISKSCRPMLFINSLWPGDTIWPQWTGTSLVQIMTYCLFGAKSLPKLMLTYCQSDDLCMGVCDNIIANVFHVYFWNKQFPILILALALRWMSLDLTDDIRYKTQFIGNKIVNYSDVVGASPVSAAPTASSFSP